MHVRLAVASKPQQPNKVAPTRVGTDAAGRSGSLKPPQHVAPPTYSPRESAPTVIEALASNLAPPTTMDRAAAELPQTPSQALTAPNARSADVVDARTDADALLVGEANKAARIAELFGGPKEATVPRVSEAKAAATPSARPLAVRTEPVRGGLGAQIFGGGRTGPQASPAAKPTSPVFAERDAQDLKDARELQRSLRQQKYELQQQADVVANAPPSMFKSTRKASTRNMLADVLGDSGPSPRSQGHASQPPKAAFDEDGPGYEFASGEEFTPTSAPTLAPTGSKKMTKAQMQKSLKLKKKEEKAIKKAADEEAKRQRKAEAEAEKKRKADEAAAKKAAAEAEKKRKADEAAAKKAAAEAEKKRKADEAAAKKAEARKAVPRSSSVSVPSTAPVAQKARNPRPVSMAVFQQSSPKCFFCEKSVYAMERGEADGMVFHKTCFRCNECHKTVSPGNYASLEGKIYCKTHFKQLFKLKGNYNEGFGTEQHKKKWVGKGANASAATLPPDATLLGDR